jgi:hypothetical protein
MRLRLGSLATAILLVLTGVTASSAVPAATPANLDEACGGKDAITCNSALWCHKEIGHCAATDVAGTCERVPNFCMRVSRPVCGCNGKTYMNECEARRAKTQVDYTGACKKSPADAASAPTAKGKSTKGAKKKSGQ